jgi:hypothetical protein
VRLRQLELQTRCQKTSNLRYYALRLTPYSAEFERQIRAHT